MGSLKRSVREIGEKYPGLPGQQDKARTGVATGGLKPAQTGHCSVRGEVRRGAGDLTSYRRDRTLCKYGGSLRLTCPLWKRIRLDTDRASCFLDSHRSSGS